MLDAELTAMAGESYSRAYGVNLPLIFLDYMRCSKMELLQDKRCL